MNFQVLEEIRQKYAGQVNFVWVYGREAHPEEFPFVDGFETVDLGWTHRYFEPTSMEERARRARWIKTDLEPDAGMPILIDYINSPLGNDNAIRAAYRGGGFYSGYLIDCDGTVLQERSWGWGNFGGQWWSLPLWPAEFLEQELDAYLADPSPCYTGPRTPTASTSSMATNTSSPTVLLVDDDEGEVFEEYFEVPLRLLRKHITVWDVAVLGTPPLGVLDAHEVVLWLTGNADADTLTAADRTALGAYLDGGGHLLLSGQDVGVDIGHTNFYTDYLHADFIADSVGVDDLVGADLLTGLTITLNALDSAGNQSSPSQIGLRDAAVGILQYDDGGAPAWAGLRWDGDYKVAYFALGLEGIGDRGAAAHRFRILQDTLAWFYEPGCAGDLDGDRHVDFADVERLTRSIGGPDFTELPPHADPAHFANADLDGDADADLHDVAALQLVPVGACP